MNLYIVLQTFNIKDVVERNLNELVVALHEDVFRIWLGVFRFGLLRFVVQLEPMYGLVYGLEEATVVDRLQQIIQGVYLVAIDGIAIERGGEDDAGVRVDELREFQSVDARHLDVQKENMNWVFPAMSFMAWMALG